MAKGIDIDGYAISVEDRKLVIDSPTLNEPIKLVFSPFQASQLSVMLNRLVPSDYGVRSDFRIPVADDLGLKVRICIDEQAFAVEATSLSLSGMYAQAAKRLGLTAGDVCDVVLGFEDQSVNLEAVVTRALSTGIGLAFTHTEPSEEFSSMVMSVQRRWISEKAV